MGDSSEAEIYDLCSVTSLKGDLFLRLAVSDGSISYVSIDMLTEEVADLV